MQFRILIMKVIGGTKKCKSAGRWVALQRYMFMNMYAFLSMK